jgi:hypothetical protein
MSCPDRQIVELAFLTARMMSSYGKEHGTTAADMALAFEAGVKAGFQERKINMQEAGYRGSIEGLLEAALWESR